MDRGRFLKTLSALFVGAAIKANVPNIFISEPKKYEKYLMKRDKFPLFVNRMTIQRKSFSFTGDCIQKTIYFNETTGE